jgi:predicted Na+-dependent transporter
VAASVFELLRSSVQFIAPVFVIATMLNVGLTQKPSDIGGHLKNRPVLLKMLLANFVFAPLLMILAGAGKNNLEDIGGLGTAQRNTAAGVIIAIQNFKDPNVFVMLTLANMLGIVTLMFVAKALSRDNRVKVPAV